MIEQKTTRRVPRHRAPKAAATTRKAIVKTYGAGATYAETKYERERREAREAASAGAVTPTDA